MYLLGALISLLIGIVLGLVGGGGSILTVPLVHYLFGTNMLIATTYSLVVVTVAAGIGAAQRVKSGQIDFRQGVVFVIPSMLTALVIRGLVMPEIPKEFELSGIQFRRDLIIASLLILVMIYTAIRTLTSKRTPSEEKASSVLVIAYGILTGLLSGLIGAGGGFIIVPILLRLGLDMRKAVGTSMFIITIQSMVALIGDIFNEEIYQQGGLDWRILILITSFTVAGVFVGTYLQKRFSGKALRKIFAFVLLLVSSGILFEKLLLPLISG